MEMLIIRKNIYGVSINYDELDRHVYKEDVYQLLERKEG